MDTTDKAIATVLLFELVDSDDEKSKKGKTRDWVKRRRPKGWFPSSVFSRAGGFIRLSLSLSITL